MNLNILRSRIKDFFFGRKGKDGAAAIEFAIAGSLVITTVVAALEILMVLMVSVLIEGGVREAARFGITGEEGENGRTAQILQIVENHTLGIVDMESATVQTLTYNSFAEIGMAEDFIDEAPYNGTYDEGENFTDSNGNGSWDLDRGTLGTGNANEIVLYVIDYELPTMTGLFDAMFHKQSFNLRAAVPVRNEPYNIQWFL